eukprot:3320252-Rhodomonas_salina.1
MLLVNDNRYSHTISLTSHTRAAWSSVRGQEPERGLLGAVLCCWAHWQWETERAGSEHSQPPSPPRTQTCRTHCQSQFAAATTTTTTSTTGSGRTVEDNNINNKTWVPGHYYQHYQHY